MFAHVRSCVQSRSQRLSPPAAERATRSRYSGLDTLDKAFSHDRILGFPVLLRMSWRNALSQSISFPIPLDKGNDGSGNEIVSRQLTITEHAHVNVLSSSGCEFMICEKHDNVLHVS